MAQIYKPEYKPVIDATGLEPGQVRINNDVWTESEEHGWVSQDGRAWMGNGWWPNEVPGAIVAKKEEAN